MGNDKYGLTTLLVAFTSFLFASCSTSVPKPPEISNNKTTQILHALQWERRGNYKRASLYWNALKKTFPDSTSIKSNLYTTLLLSGNKGAFLKIRSLPLTGKESVTFKILLSRIYFWEGNPKKSLHSLNPTGSKKDQERFQLGLEQVRLYLFSGDYITAEKLLTELQPLHSSDSFGRHYYQLALYQLMEKKEKKQRLLDTIEKEHFYIPLIGIDSTEADLMFLRFPAETYFVDQLINHYLEKENGLELKALLQSGKGTGVMEVTTHTQIPIAKSLFYSGDQQPLQTLLQTDFKREQNWIDLAARNAIRRQNWSVLKEMALLLNRKYPDTLDGNIYLAEYYRQTGDLNREKKLNEEIRQLLSSEEREALQLE